MKTFRLLTVSRNINSFGLRGCMMLWRKRYFHYRPAWRAYGRPPEVNTWVFGLVIAVLQVLFLLACALIVKHC